MRCLFLTSVLAASAIFAASCGSVEGSPGAERDAGGDVVLPLDAATDAGVRGPDGAVCIFPGPRNTPWRPADKTKCPTGCLPVEATELDPSGTCARRVLLGCLGCPDGCGGRLEGPPCLKYVPDGRIFWGAPGYTTDGNEDFVECTQAEYDALRAKPLDVCTN